MQNNKFNSQQEIVNLNDSIFNFVQTQDNIGPNKQPPQQESLPG